MERIWKKISTYLLILSLMLMASTRASPADELQANAQFTPASIYLDQSSNYELLIDGVSHLGNIYVPKIDGLIFFSESKSTNMAFGLGQGSQISTRLV